jgi:transposase
MLMPAGPSATRLSQEVGVGQQTLSRWLREATTLDPVTKRQKDPRQAGAAPEQARPEDRTAEEKLRLVLEAGQLNEAELGEFLRRHGIHEANLAAWRDAAIGGLSATQRAPARSTDARRVRELEKELRRKDKALAETAALLVLQKKVHAIWGDEDDDTKPGNDD